jgi:hypothetical protein
MRTAIVTLSVGLVIASLGACSSSSREGYSEVPNDVPDGSTGPIGPGLGGDASTSVDITLKGTVFAPNGSLPLSNALVYVTTEAPAPIPGGAYCDECVTLPEDTFAVSAADGTFEFTSRMPTGNAFIVVQKGQFRRVRPLKIEKAGPIDLAAEITTVPGHSDPKKGDDVPKMVILKDDTDFDKIDESLTKLGLGALDIRQDRSLLENEVELMKYHIVFIPCGSSDDLEATSSRAKANLQKFVQAGGKLYVTDWSYEFVRQPFTGYLNWEGETATIGSAASGDEWDAPAHADDPGLAEWLAATGDPTFNVVGNWTTITAVNSLQGPDVKGTPAEIVPKVWVSAQKPGTNVLRPTTVSFQNQCGRVLFSTYHTEAGLGTGTKLLAQEKALLYVLLEVGVCVGDRQAPR